jgi:hypothetical protein
MSINGRFLPYELLTQITLYCSMLKKTALSDIYNYIHQVKYEPV